MPEKTRSRRTKAEATAAPPTTETPAVIIEPITKRVATRNYPTTLGYDIEFILRNGKMMMPANDFISDPKKNKPVGLDGVTDLVEMRGGISTNPSQF